MTGMHRTEGRIIQIVGNHPLYHSFSIVLRDLIIGKFSFKHPLFFHPCEGCIDEYIKKKVLLKKLKKNFSDDLSTSCSNKQSQRYF